MAAFYSLLCKAIKKQPAGRSGRLFWRSGRDSNPRAIARKLISSHFSLMIFSGNYAKMEVHNGSQNSAVYCGFRLPFFDFI